MKKFVALAVLLAFLPTLVIAADLGDFTIGDADYNIFKLIFSSNVPNDILTSDKVLQFLVFPFVSVTMIMYGILSELRIFRRINWVNGALAILIALISSSTGYLWAMVQIFFVTGGYFGTLAFGVLLVVGIFLWAASRLWGWGVFRGGGWRGVLRASREVFEYEEQIARYRDLISDLRALGSVDALEKAKELEKEIERLKEKKEKMASEAAKTAVEQAKSKERPHAGVG